MTWTRSDGVRVEVVPPALKEAFGREFPMVKLFEHATIAAQASFLDASEETPREDGGERGKARREAMKNRRRRGRAR